MITRSPDLRLIYDDRAKEEKDNFSFAKDARAEGKAEGKAEGIEKGLAEGEAKGLAEGEVKGKLIGRIQVLQQLLGVTQPDQASLSVSESSQLKKLADELQLQFAKHDS